jgi:anthranilate phosphoribosyltransferase
VRTLFNILGPLTNPAGATRQLLGVFHPDLVGIQVRVLERLGSQRALVVHGSDGLDEITLAGDTLVGELKDGKVSEYVVSPTQFGLAPASTDAIRVADAAEAKAVLLAVLEDVPGPARDIVLLNAGATLYVAGVAVSIAAGVDRARQALASGAAKDKLQALVAFRPQAAG